VTETSQLTLIGYYLVVPAKGGDQIIAEIPQSFYVTVNGVG
jgi:hypothetical protein